MDRTERTAIWKGLNRMPYIGDGEMRDMKNLSSDAYPFITTRKGRKPYTFITKIPSPEGEAYRDIERLPEPCDEELGNVYKITTDATEPEYASGEFYYYKGGAWVKGRIAPFEGTTSVAGTDWLVSNSYKNGKNVSEKDMPTYADSTNFYGCAYTSDLWYNSILTSSSVNGYNTDYKYRGCTVKYLGEDTECFKRGKTYVYTMYVTAYWKSTESTTSDGSKKIIPTASAYLAREVTKYKYAGETTDEFTNGVVYKCVVDSYCVWEECEQQYDVMESMPEDPAENQQVRFISRNYGAPMQKKYYLCECDVDNDGELIYFYSNPTSAEVYTELGYLPQANAENEKVCFEYTGVTTAGEFARCYYNASFYGWEVIVHPEVERIVTLKDYLDNYDGSGLQEILEIGTFNDGLAALIIDGNAECKLYYDEKLWSVRSVSHESGKRLITLGNRLVVGESGSYLHLKESKKEYENVTREIEFFESGSSFSYSVIAKDYHYGNGGKEEDQWSAYGSASGKAFFELYAKGGQGAQLKALYEGLNVEGTDFSVYSKKKGKAHKQYLTVTSVTFDENKLIYAWRVGDYWHYDYADVLTISAEGARDKFDWYRATGDTLVFESTDPHYYDIAAWRKRLWGYDSNVLHGTVAGIFDKYGIVDWNTGDNTYTEAISQPLWQGGDITGIAALMNGLVYFKEDCITIVTGNYPAVMSSNTIPCRGLPPENRRSVAVANECVYYLSTDGVYRFDGNIPRCISRDVKISGTDAVGASDGNKYWLSLKEDSGEYALYVYDINYGIWHKEDATQAASFVMLGGEMYMAVGTEIYNLNSPQEDVSWECELWYDEGTHRKKKYKEIIVRGNVGECELYLKPDDGEWKLIGAVENKMRMKFIPFDCEELHLKLKGKGICEIKSIDRTFEVV